MKSLSQGVTVKPSLSCGLCAGRGRAGEWAALLMFALLILLGQQRAGAQLVTILSEGFEGAFPGAWTVSDTNFAGPPTHWKNVDAAFGGEGAHTGGSKGYCAGIGNAGTAADPQYQPNMGSFMEQSVNLAGYTAAYLSFWYKIPSIESGYDEARVYLDSDLIWSRTNEASGWSQASLDLSGYVGGSRTLQFEFFSDGSVERKGWYLDDILVTAFAAPPNDNFADATILDGPSGTIRDSNANATKETAAGEINIFGNAGGASVWYRWTARTSGTVTFTTDGSRQSGGAVMDTLLAAYTGNSVGGLSLLSESDDVPADRTSAITFNVVAGTEYKIAVDGYSGEIGNLVLNWSYDSAFNVSATVEGATFTRHYAVKTIPGRDSFIGQADFTLRRYDDSTGALQTDPITVRLDYSLVDMTDGSNVTLTANSVTLVKAMPSFDELFVGPREPAYRSFSETFPIQPAPGVQLDSVNRLYQLVVTISHVDAPGQPALTDHTRAGASEPLLHFNGNLLFGNIETRLTGLANEPPITFLAAPDFLRSLVAVPSGFIAGKPLYTFGGVFAVDLLPNGDSRVVGPTSALVSTPPLTPDEYEVARVRYRRLATTLTENGAQSGLRVTLPTGLGWRADTASRKLFGTIDFPAAALNQSLDPIGPELFLGGPLFVCEESKPFWIAAPYLSWQIAAGSFVLPPESGFLYVRREETDRLEAIAPGVLANSDEGFKRSNEGYCRSPVTVTSPQVSVRADANGHALLSASLRFEPRLAGFQTHFPYDSLVRWAGRGEMHILDDQVQPATSFLTNVLPVSLTYARDCPDGKKCPEPEKGAEGLALNPHSEQLRFTVDGGLAGTGVPSANTLTWGWIAPKGAFAQRATNFTDAAFHAPGMFLRGDQAAAQLVEDRPATLLYTGVGQTDLTQLDRYGTPAYAAGLGDYAGLNFRARTGTVPPSRGASTLAGRPTGEYPLTSRSKYYARPGGVSGIHEAISFPGRLELYGYQVNFDNFGLAYRDSENIDSRTHGFIPLPLPSRFTNEFEELTFTCLGALKDAKVPASSTNKPLEYWKGKFDPLAIQFASDTPCDPTKGYLVLGVVTRVAHIDAPLYGRLGFTTNGTLITAADGLITHINSRLRLPNRFNLKGPAAESYTFNPVGEAYFNNWDDFKADGSVGFVNLAGTADVPFFEDLQAHMQTSADRNSSSALIYLTGGWTDLGKTFFNAPSGFDEANRGFPSSVPVAEYRTGVSHPVRARQNWLGIVSFNYPLSWSSTRRTFQSPAPVEDGFAVLRVKHQVKYLSPQNAHLAFGLQYGGVPQINIANMAFNAIDDATGMSKALAETISEEARAAIEKGLKQFDQLLQAQMQDFLAPVIVGLTDPVIETLYTTLSNKFQPSIPSGLKPGGWPANAAAIDDILQSHLLGVGAPVGAPTVLGKLQELDRGVDGALGMVNKVDGYLKDVTNAIEKLQTVVKEVPKAAILIQKMAEKVGSAGRVADDAVKALLKEAGPTLAQISSTLSDISATVATARSKLASGGDFATELRGVINQTEPLRSACTQVHEDMTNFLAHLDYTATSPFNEHSPEEIKKLIRQKLMDHFFASTVAPALQNVFKQRLYDTDAALREAIDSAFGQFNSITKDLIAQSLAEVDKSINRFLEPLNDVMGSGKIDGYAQIKGDSLVCLRLDGSFQWKVPDEMEFNGYLQIKELDSDGTNTCVEMGGKATEVTVGAREVELDWISPDLRADVEGKFSFASGPIGMGGSFRVTGPLEFSGFKITELGATMAFGRDENYLGAKARVKFQQYEFAGGIFFGRTCTMAPLLLVDPMVAESLPPPPLTGAYVYAEGWFPINEAIGIPSSCFFNIRAGIGAGAFYFLAGEEKVPTYGGKMLLGLSGEVLCIVSVEGKVVLVGVKSGGDLTFNGRGSVSGDIGKCPFCIGFSKTVGLRYRNGDWNLDF